MLAKDLGSRGVTVNCIAPGPIETEMFRKGKPEQLINFFENLHPQKRLGKADEITGIVALLAGPGGSWINGQTIQVNGVRRMRCLGLRVPLRKLMVSQGYAL